MTCSEKPEVLETLRSNLGKLAVSYSVKSIGVFGSVARGDHNDKSDVDILVELGEPTLDHYMDLKYHLEEILQRPVDLVLADTVKPRLKPIVEREVVYA
jgi:predicted nucleotidyltransferase